MKKYFLYTLMFVAILSACKREVTNPTLVNEFPPIYPDYVGVTIPVNIAPMNFDIDEATNPYLDVMVKGGKEGSLHVQGNVAQFPLKQWKALLAKNQGDSLVFTVSVQREGGWTQYRDFSMYISNDSIEYGVAYRLVAPGYVAFGKMGIYERDLSCFDEHKVVENTLVPLMCVNCHSVNKTNPEQLSLHIRGKHGATLMQTGGEAELLNTKTDSTLAACVYPYWHPTGEYIAYSTNNTKQVFHSAKEKIIEVYDNESNVMVYHPQTHTLLRTALLEQTTAFETFPAFSPDGRTLYFCSASAKELPKDYDQIRYDLCSIAFNPEDGTFGNQIDTLIHASSHGKSISFPRPSYDGRYLMYTLFDYGNFSIWHKEADLWLLDLQTGEQRPLTTINSDDTESFHNWSSNSRWCVFSSRRDDGRYTRLYFSHINKEGVAAKPFLMPQEDPIEYYKELPYAYNVPDFINQPIDVNSQSLGEGLLSDERIQITAKAAK